MRLYFLIIPLFLTHSIFGQNQAIDSLKQLGDEELLDLFAKVEYDSLAAEMVAQVYLGRAKREQDTIKMARGYERLAVIYNPTKNVQYADSIVRLTSNLKHMTYPAVGYALKGFNYTVKDDLVRSTDNFLLAHKIAKERGNLPLQLYCSNYLIFAKAIWGDKAEALRLAKENYKVFDTKEYRQSLVNSTREEKKDKIDQYIDEYEISHMQTFAFCYFKLNELDSARLFMRRASSVAADSNRNHGNEESWALEMNLEIEFSSGNYSKSVKNAEKLLKNYEQFLDYSSKRNIYLFLGLSHLKVGEMDLGIQNLKVADSIYDYYDNSINQPYQRKLFEELRSYYSQLGDLNMELGYIDKIVRADSIIIENYKYFEPTLINGFETPLLIQRKEEIIDSLQAQRKFSRNLFWITIGLLFSLSILTWYYFDRQRTFKRRFDLLAKDKQRTRISLDKVIIENNLSSQVINSLLESLDEFEGGQKFLDPTINLNELAKNFDSNPRYLSRVINLRKEKNFSQYLNDLRTSYAFEKLKNDSKFRNYTIKAVAQESGFNRAESFSRAFYKNYGIYPSYYIKQLQKEK